MAASVFATWKLADGAAAQTTAASATFVGVILGLVTLFNVFFTRNMVNEMRLEREVAEERQRQDQHSILASFHAQLNRWHEFTSEGRPPHLPMSLDLYRASAPYLSRLWDEIRLHFVDIEARITALNVSSPEDRELQARLARYIHEDLQPLSNALHAYLFEYAVGCGRPGPQHTWRINEVHAVGHDRHTLQASFRRRRCPACNSPLIVYELGADISWQADDGAYHARTDLEEWPAGSVIPLDDGIS